MRQVRGGREVLPPSRDRGSFSLSFVGRLFLALLLREGVWNVVVMYGTFDRQAQSTITDDVLDEFLGITVLRPTLLVHRRSSHPSPYTYSSPSLSKHSAPTSPNARAKHHHHQSHHPYCLHVRTASARGAGEKDRDSAGLSPVSMSRALRRASSMASKRRRKTPSSAVDERSSPWTSTFDLHSGLGPDHYADDPLLGECLLACWGMGIGIGR